MLVVIHQGNKRGTYFLSKLLDQLYPHITMTEKKPRKILSRLLNRAYSECIVMPPNPCWIITKRR